VKVRHGPIFTRNRSNDPPVAARRRRPSGEIDRAAQRVERARTSLPARARPLGERRRLQRIERVPPARPTTVAIVAGARRAVGFAVRFWPRRWCRRRHHVRHRKARSPPRRCRTSANVTHVARRAHPNQRWIVDPDRRGSLASTESRGAGKRRRSQTLDDPLNASSSCRVRSIASPGR